MNFQNNYEPILKNINCLDLGYFDGSRYITNLSISDQDGSLTNKRLLAMSDDQLMRMAEHNGSVAVEEYRRPSEYKECESQGGGKPGEIYLGIHRAKLILLFRDKTRRAFTHN